MLGKVHSSAKPAPESGKDDNHLKGYVSREKMTPGPQATAKVARQPRRRRAGAARRRAPLAGPRATRCARGERAGRARHADVDLGVPADAARRHRPPAALAAGRRDLPPRALAGLQGDHRSRGQAPPALGQRARVAPARAADRVRRAPGGDRVGDRPRRLSPAS